MGLKDALSICAMFRGTYLDYKEKADALNSLGLATALICINPFAVSDTSAVLSVLSVLGMLAIKPKIDSYLKPVKANKFSAAAKEAIEAAGGQAEVI